MLKAQSVSETKTVDMTQLVGGSDDESLMEELETCEHFLVDSDRVTGRRRVFIFAMNILDAYTLNQKLETVFQILKCAANLNLAFGFLLKNAKDGTCLYYYAHENNTAGTIKICGDQIRFSKVKECVE